MIWRLIMTWSLINFIRNICLLDEGDFVGWWIRNVSCLSIRETLPTPFRSIWFALTNSGSLEITDEIHILEVVSYHVPVNMSRIVLHVDIENHDAFAHEHHRCRPMIILFAYTLINNIKCFRDIISVPDNQ